METATKDIVNFTIEDTADQLRMESYHSIFSEAGHLWLAMHAAFPIALTTDLLYKIWMNFIPHKEEISTNEPYGKLCGKILEGNETPKDNPIPINAVGDILLSPLCREIGHDLYEFYPHLREMLWKTLPLKRQLQLADFVLRYLEFCPDKIPSKAFAESQRIWAEITLGQFDRVNSRLAELYASDTLQNATSQRDFILNLIAQKTDNVADKSTNEALLGNTSLSDVEKLTQGVSAYKQGNQEVARNYLESIRQNLSSEKTTKGFNVPIPKALWESLPVPTTVTEPPKGKIYAVLVGIDEYGKLSVIGNIAHTISFQEILQSNFQEKYLPIITHIILNEKAIKHAVLLLLEQLLSKSNENDQVIFLFAGHGINKTTMKGNDDSLLLYTPDFQTYQQVKNNPDVHIYSTEIRNLLLKYPTPKVTLILDTSSGSNNWLDTANEKQLLISASYQFETQWGGIVYGGGNNKIGQFIPFLLESLKELNFNSTPRRLINSIFHKNITLLGRVSGTQTPQLFGHSKTLNQAFLGGSFSQATYISELLQECGYQNIQKVISDFEIDNQEEILIATLEKYSLLKGSEKLKVVRISSEMSVRQIPIFQHEYVRKLPYEVEIKDISLFYSPSRAGLKDSMGYQEDVEDDLSALQDANVIVFVLNRALVNDFARHTAIAPVVNHLKRFEYKVVCSILWEDCDWESIALRDYPVFAKTRPLSKSFTQAYKDFDKTYPSIPEVENEIEEYYQDWRPVINKWITDLAALGFEKELKERIEKAKQTQELDLSGMGFEKLPEAVWELEDLKIIDLYNNKLTELPESLTQFQSLEKLYASKNPITALPLFLSDLPKLRVLKIDDAQITEFPNWLCKHPALEDISLENNQIEIIPSALKDLPKLRLIDFRGNPVINLSESVLKATKGKLTEHISIARTNPPEFSDYRNEIVILFLSNGEKKELSFITNFFILKNEQNIQSSSSKPFDNTYALDTYAIPIINSESIFHFPAPNNKTLIVHLPPNNLSDEEVQKLSKLFLEYPTGTIFFLNFSNSKQLADLLYQQKHVPIIAFEGELDPKEGLEAVRLFYSHYQESKNAMAAFDQMVLQLVDIPSSSKGLYILYRY